MDNVTQLQRIQSVKNSNNPRILAKIISNYFLNTQTHILKFDTCNAVRFIGVLQEITKQD